MAKRVPLSNFSDELAGLQFILLLSATGLLYLSSRSLVISIALSSLALSLSNEFLISDIVFFILVFPLEFFS